MVHQSEPQLRVDDPRCEDELKDAIALAIGNAFDDTRTVVITGFGLDVAVSTENTEGAARTCFIEAKVAKITSNRINIDRTFTGIGRML